MESSSPAALTGDSRGNWTLYLTSNLLWELLCDTRSFQLSMNRIIGQRQRGGEVFQAASSPNLAPRYNSDNSQSGGRKSRWRGRGGLSGTELGGGTTARRVETKSIISACFRKTNHVEMFYLKIRPSQTDSPAEECSKLQNEHFYRKQSDCWNMRGFNYIWWKKYNWKIKIKEAEHQLQGLARICASFSF